MKLLAALVIVLSLSACSLPVFYRVPIVQGNVVTNQQIDMLHKGMTKKQVEYILGEPLVKSPFQSNRWDYVFYYRNPRAHVRQSTLSLFFSNGRLSGIKGSQAYLARALRSQDQSGAESSLLLPGQTANPTNNQINPSQPAEAPGNPAPEAEETAPMGPQTQPSADNGTIPESDASVPRAGY